MGRRVVGELPPVVEGDLVALLVVGHQLGQRQQRGSVFVHREDLGSRQRIAMISNVPSFEIVVHPVLVLLRPLIRVRGGVVLFVDNLRHVLPEGLEGLYLIRMEDTFAVGVHFLSVLFCDVLFGILVSIRRGLSEDLCLSLSVGLLNLLFLPGTQLQFLDSRHLLLTLLGVRLPTLHALHHDLSGLRNLLLHIRVVVPKSAGRLGHRPPIPHVRHVPRVLVPDLLQNCLMETGTAVVHRRSLAFVDRVRCPQKISDLRAPFRCVHPSELGQELNGGSDLRQSVDSVEISVLCDLLAHMVLEHNVQLLPSRNARERFTPDTGVEAQLAQQLARSADSALPSQLSHRFVDLPHELLSVHYGGVLGVLGNVGLQLFHLPDAPFDLSTSRQVDVLKLPVLVCLLGVGIRLQLVLLLPVSLLQHRLDSRYLILCRPGLLQVLQELLVTEELCESVGQLSNGVNVVEGLLLLLQRVRTEVKHRVVVNMLGVETLR
mmetsp:Transcript_28701/g.56207  ORF Transcript_28701/g.56207 Transcript_28701/m.56207 type:complete len:489 (+) Transcript_28701:1742-3208(+)